MDPLDYTVLRNVLRNKIDFDASHTGADGFLDDMARKTVSHVRGLCRVWIETKGDMEALVKDAQQRMLKGALSGTVQVIVQRCIRYMDGFLTHTRRARGEWDEIASGVLRNLRTWFETTGYAMVRERYTAPHLTRTNLFDVVFREYGTALGVYLNGIRHTLCDYELQLILDWINPCFEKMVNCVVFDIDTERAEQNARELLEEVEEEAPVRVSKNKRRKARRREIERVSKEEDCVPSPPNVEAKDCVPAPPNVEEITDALSANTVCTDNEDEATLCVVCMDAQRTHLIAPCGHKCLCESCSTTFGTTCPICRADAMLVCKVFD